MDWTVATYVAYLLVSIPLTLAVGATLARHGRVFLDDVFPDDDVATSVNRLLVVGFHLVNLGFVSLFLRAGADVPDLRGLVEELSTKVGVVALVLGVLHVGNLVVLTTVRRRHRLDQLRSRAPQPPAPAVYGPPFPAAHR